MKFELGKLYRLKSFIEHAAPSGQSLERGQVAMLVEVREADTDRGEPEFYICSFLFRDAVFDFKSPINPLEEDVQSYSFEEVK